MTYLQQLRDFIKSKLVDAGRQPFTQRRKLAQILFTADPELKSKVLEKAKRHGITIKSLFVFCMKAYLENKIQVSLIGTPEFPIKKGSKTFKTEEQIIQEDAARLVKNLKRSYVCQPRDIP